MHNWTDPYLTIYWTSLVAEIDLEKSPQKRTNFENLVWQEAKAVEFIFSRFIKHVFECIKKLYLHILI